MAVRHVEILLQLRVRCDGRQILGQRFVQFVVHIRVVAGVHGRDKQEERNDRVDPPVPDGAVVHPGQVRDQGFMVPFRDPFIHQKQQRRQHEDDGRDAQQHAFRHDDADVLSQGKAHKAQGQEAGDGGAGTARQGAERRHDSVCHGVPVILAALFLLFKGVVQEHGIVHGDAQLQHRGDGLRNVGDLSHKDVRAEVVYDGESDVDQQNEGQHPGFHGQGHGDEGQHDSHQDEQGHLPVHQFLRVFDDHGEPRQEAFLVAQGADLPNGAHGLVGGAGMLVLDDHHGAGPGIEGIPHLLGDEVRGDLHAHQVGEPHDAGDAGHFLDRFRQFVRIAGRHAVHHQHGSRCHVERVFQQLHALRGVQIRRQIR